MTVLYLDTLYFHDLPRCEEGTMPITRPHELADEMFRRHHAFLMGKDDPVPLVPVVLFAVEGPERMDRYALIVRADLVDGSPEANADSIRRTAPRHWSVSVREGTV